MNAVDRAKPAAQGRWLSTWRLRRWLQHLPLVLVTPLSAPAVAADLLPYSDFGRADILLTAATIRQSGDTQTAVIHQTTDIASTDRTLYPIGTGNIADVVQDGGFNQAYLEQSGNLNRARIVQDGLGNLVQATQLGVANTLDVLQTGASNSLVSSQDGTANAITLKQAGGNTAMFTETGDHNTINVQQIVGGPALSINLVGSGLSVTIKQ